jgi:hypothetical protein
MVNHTLIDALAHSGRALTRSTDMTRCHSHSCPPGQSHPHWRELARVHGRVARDAITEASGHAASWAAPHAEAAIQWATPRAQAAWRQGVAAAAPRVEEAARLLSPKIDLARDRLKEQVLPAIVYAVNRAAEVAAQNAGRPAVEAPAAKGRGAKARGVKCRPSKRQAVRCRQAPKRKGRAAKILGWSALAALACAIAYAIWANREPESDPWSEDEAWDIDAVTFTPTTQGPAQTPEDGAAQPTKDQPAESAEAGEASAEAAD